MHNVSEKTVTCRKDHQCWGCCETIKIGEKAFVQTNVDGGCIHSVYTCFNCQIVIDILDSCTLENMETGDIVETVEYKEMYKK